MKSSDQIFEYNKNPQLASVSAIDRVKGMELGPRVLLSDLSNVPGMSGFVGANLTNATTLGSGASAAKVAGTVAKLTRADGTAQAAYFNMPSPGGTAGRCGYQNVLQFWVYTEGITSPTTPISPSSSYLTTHLIRTTDGANALTYNPSIMQGSWKLVEVLLTDYVLPAPIGTTVTSDVSATSGTVALNSDTLARLQFRIGADATNANALAVYLSGVYLKSRGPAFLIVETDDNRIEFLRKAVPICRRLGIPMTHNVITDKLLDSDSNYWKRDDNDKLYADGDDIANHTKTHGLTNTGLDTGSLAQQQVDILDAMELLQGWGYSRSAMLLGYPYGRYNANTLTILADNNIKLARVASGTHQANIIDSKYHIKTFPVINTVSVASALAVVDKAIATGSTCSLLFHNILDTAASDANPAVATDYPLRRFEQLMEQIAVRIGAGLIIPVTRSQWEAMASQVSVTQ
jgi:peptidoglycan/xylan/chitin deacetylase (PgdA/CDA1 family)